jgi:hypothetical protein
MQDPQKGRDRKGFPIWDWMAWYPLKSVPFPFRNNQKYHKLWNSSCDLCEERDARICAALPSLKEGSLQGAATCLERDLMEYVVYEKC